MTASRMGHLHPRVKLGKDDGGVELLGTFPLPGGRTGHAGWFSGWPGADLHLSLAGTYCGALHLF